ncbi:MAG: hypothetical protein ACLR8S_00010 [Paraprevotella clara]
MKNRLKRVCALLLAIMMLMSTLSLNVFAGSVIPGTKDEKIHLGWKYFEYDEDNEAAGAAVQALEAGKTYCVRLAFFDNPSDENSTVTGATISVRYDAEAVNIPDTGEATVNSVFYEYQGTFIPNNDGNGLLTITLATTSGIRTNRGKLVTAGNFFEAVFEAKKTVTEDELKTLFHLGSETNMIFDVNEKDFTIVECPAFTARVKDGAADFFPTTTAAKIAENLVGEYIDENGNVTAVSDFTVTLPATGLVEGNNVVKASYNGYTCDVTIKVEHDTVASISVTNQPNLEYTSGQALNLDALEVTATFGSGNTDVITSGYTTDPENGTILTVADNNGHPVTITYDGQAATTDNLIVNQADISSASIAAVGPFEYDNGNEIKPTPAITLGEKLLENGVDYDLSYADNINVGTATLTATGKGEYQGTVSATFQITKATGKLTLKVNNEENAVTITYGDSITFSDGNGIAIGTDITIHYQMGETTDAVYDTATTQLNVGTYTFWAVRSGDANHDEATSNKVVVIIKQRNIASLDITVADQTYSGAAVKPDVTVRHGNIVLNEIDDYTLSGYDGNVNVTDNASVNVTGTGNYNGEATLTFKINPKNLGDISNSFTSIANLPDKGYTGEQIKPEVTEKTITIDSDTLEVRRDYEIIYGENTNAGTATVTVKPVDGSNYTFTQFTHEFQITKVKIQIVGADFIVALSVRGRI